MINANDNDYPLFVLAQHEGRDRLVFTTPATLNATTPGQMPLWWHEPADDVAQHSLTVWLGEHRHLWPAWRDLSERDGTQALSDEIARAWAGGIESCHSMMMSQGAGPRELAFYAILVTRKSEVARHRFKTKQHRRVFSDWFLRDIEANAGFLLIEGCLVGPKHLGRIMDAIAASELANRQQPRERQTERHQKAA